MGFGPLLEDKLCLIFKLAPSVCRMTFPILASLLVRLVVLLPFQLLRLSLATPSRWTPLALSVFLHCVVELTKLGYDATPFNQILKQNAKREMRLRLGKVTVADVLAAQPVTTNLLKFMRASIKMIGVSNLQSFIASMTQKLTLSDISDESKNYLDKAGITTACLRIKSKWTAGGK